MQLFINSKVNIMTKLQKTHVTVKIIIGLFQLQFTALATHKGVCVHSYTQIAHIN